MSTANDLSLKQRCLRRKGDNTVLIHAAMESLGCTNQSFSPNCGDGIPAYNANGALGSSTTESLIPLRRVVKRNLSRLNKQPAFARKSYPHTTERMHRLNR